MLKSIDYSVSFPTTGRSFQNRIEFAPGLTAITGRNEQGKTLNIEMIGYCLFGKEALRGLATDYKNLAATLCLEVLGKDVVIDRGKKETLTIDGEVKAVGAQAINAEIPKLLGFGLDVFNVACAAQQGDLDALTRMRPTERRQMVDRLIGIDVLEAIEKECRAEAKTAETVAMSLVVSLPVPHEPVRPDDYAPSAELEQLVTTIQDHERTRMILSQIQEPTQPVTPAHTDGDVAELEQHEAQRQAALREQASLEGQLRGLPVATVSRDDLERAIAFGSYQEEVRRRGHRPSYTIDKLHQMQHVYDQRKLLIGEHVECPKCEHQFMTLNPGVDVAAIEALEDPELSPSEITTHFRRHELWSEPLTEVTEFTVPNVQQEILAHARADDRSAISDKLRDLVVPADRSGEARAARAYQQELAVYGERRARYDQELANFRDARARLDGMADRAVELGLCQVRLGVARSYEGQSERYQLEQARYDNVMAQSSERRDCAEGFKRGATSLKNARVRVKQELAPDLSRAASSLLNAMTSGERQHVDVDEDFNILVDGQPLQTLSGSGKSVVNLALRIGLGQVLTSRVLPIFMGDEIDKDMDQFRASSTHSTLHNLKKYLTQIIIVTHKDIEADHTVNLDMVSA